MEGCGVVEGPYLAPADGRIPIFDRGGATYDVAQVWYGCFFRLDDHLDHFVGSLAALDLDRGSGAGAQRR